MAQRLKPGGFLGQRKPRVIDKMHKEFVSKMPCLITGLSRVEVAHVRYGDPEMGKPSTGMQQKPDDRWTVPLAPHVHREGPDAQHGSNERLWWEKQRIDPLKVATALYACSGNLVAGRKICEQARKGEFQ